LSRGWPVLELGKQLFAPLNLGYGVVEILNFRLENTASRVGEDASVIRRHLLGFPKVVLVGCTAIWPTGNPQQRTLKFDCRLPTFIPRIAGCGDFPACRPRRRPDRSPRAEVVIDAQDVIATSDEGRESHTASKLPPLRGYAPPDIAPGAMSFVPPKAIAARRTAHGLHRLGPNTELGQGPDDKAPSRLLWP
jgi:hypothetical protein